MTGLETMIAKVSNAAAVVGTAPAVVVLESWRLEEMRRQALEAEERRFEQVRRQNRRMWRYGCE